MQTYDQVIALTLGVLEHQHVPCMEQIEGTRDQAFFHEWNLKGETAGGDLEGVANDEEAEGEGSEGGSLHQERGVEEGLGMESEERGEVVGRGHVHEYVAYGNRERNGGYRREEPECAEPKRREGEAQGKERVDPEHDAILECRHNGYANMVPVELLSLSLSFRKSALARWTRALVAPTEMPSSRAISS